MVCYIVEKWICEFKVFYVANCYMSSIETLTKYKLFYATKIILWKSIMH